MLLWRFLFIGIFGRFESSMGPPARDLRYGWFTISRAKGPMLLFLFAMQCSRIWTLRLIRRFNLPSFYQFKKPFQDRLISKLKTRSRRPNHASESTACRPTANRSNPSFSNSPQVGSLVAVV